MLQNSLLAAIRVRRGCYNPDIHTMQLYQMLQVGNINGFIIDNHGIYHDSQFLKVKNTRVPRCTGWLSILISMDWSLFLRFTSLSRSLVSLRPCPPDPAETGSNPAPLSSMTINKSFPSCLTLKFNTPFPAKWAN